MQTAQLKTAPRAPSASPKILVTGASTGIGLAFAHAFAQQGRAVVLVSRRPDALAAAMHTLPGTGHEAIAADLGTPAGVERVIARLEHRPRIDVLINNAGGGRYGAFHTDAAREQLDLVALNCTALAALAHAFLRLAQPGDCLVNVSSVLAFMAQPTSAVYAASKAFVTSLSEALWYENKTRDVYVMGLHPGITRTEFRMRAGGTSDYPASAQTPEAVVQTTMHHLRLRKKPTVVCGALNSWLACLPRLFTRKGMVSFLGTTRSRDPRAKPAGSKT